MWRLTTCLAALLAASLSLAAPPLCLTSNDPAFRPAGLKTACYQVVWSGTVQPKHPADVRFRGWVPFEQGFLTNGRADKMDYVNAYTETAQMSRYNWGPDDYTIDVDLGQVCEVTSVKLDANHRWANLLVYYPKARRWLPVASGVPTLEVKGLRCRRLRVETGGHPRHLASFSEMYIYGTPLEPGAAEAWPAPAAPKEEAVPYVPLSLKASGVEPIAPDPFILPQPQEMVFTADLVKLPRVATVVLPENAGPDVQNAAAVLADFMGRLMDIEFQPAKAADGPAVWLGLPAHGGKWADLAARRKVAAGEIPAEGYALEVTPAGAVLVGVDERGLLNAARSLVLLARPERGGGMSLPLGHVRDFPREPFRGIFASEAWANEFKANLLTVLALFKNNLVFARTSRACREIAERQRLSLVDGESLMPGSRCGTGGDLLEIAPGYKREDLDPRRLSACCSHTEYWPGMFKAFPQKPSDPPGQFVDVCYDEIMHNPWMVCARCRARGLTQREMLLDTYMKAYRYLTARQYRVALYCTGYVHVSKAFDMFLDIPVEGVTVMNYDRPKENRTMRDRGFNVIAVAGKTIPLQPDSPNHTGMIQFWAAETRANMISGPIPAQLMQAEENWATAGKVEFESPAWHARRNRALQIAKCIIDETPLEQPGVTREYFTLDLSKQANRTLRDDVWGDGEGWLDEGPLRDLRHLPVGRQTLNGLPWQIGASAVVVAGPGSADHCYPDQVLGVPVGRTAGRLVFLHTCARKVYTDLLRTVTLLGFYRVRYADDTFLTIPVTYRQHLLEWTRDFGYRKMEVAPTGSPVGDAEVAWRGATDGGQDVTLFAMPWVNPYPEKPIASIDVLASAQTESNANQLCLLAVTGSVPTDTELAVARKRTKRPELRPWRARPDLPPGVVSYDLTRRTMHPRLVQTDPAGCANWKTDDNWIHGVVSRATIDKNETSFGVYSALDPDDDAWRSDAEPRGDEEHSAKAELNLKFKRLLPLRAVGVKGILQRPRSPGLWPADFSVDLLTENGDWKTIGEVKGHVGQEGEERWVLPKAFPAAGLRIRLTRGQGISAIYLYGPAAAMDLVTTDTAPKVGDPIKKKVTKDDARDELEGL